MHTVEIQLNGTELCEAMNAMRAWLDDRRFEPSAFVSHENKGKILVSVSFKVGEEAEAFATHFAGRLTGFQTEGGELPPSGSRPVTDAGWAVSSSEATTSMAPPTAAAQT